jgi:protein-S-isoprenylcysteine O-methyltransferase Ste14
MSLAALEIRIPPPLVALACAIAMWLLADVGPVLPLPGSVRTGGAIAIAALGLAIMLAGVVSFRHAKTTINPLKPESSTALVTSGVYEHTRNPMYLGMLVILIGWATYLSSPLALLGPVAFYLFIGRFQIGPEERALEKLFGADFERYKTRVRRWI